MTLTYYHLLERGWRLIKLGNKKTRDTLGHDLPQGLRTLERAGDGQSRVSRVADSCPAAWTSCLLLGASRRPPGRPARRND